ncbi:hypothetical protein B0E44_17975 [Flavobacterium sp. A45]|nr:hypothetical protein B0E44_17975 [Flavobacterium sp. A45]
MKNRDDSSKGLNKLLNPLYYFLIYRNLYFFRNNIQNLVVTPIIIGSFFLFIGRKFLLCDFSLRNFALVSAECL